MARSSLLMHAVMIICAVAIGYLYIYPTIQQIRQNQDQAVIFNQEVAKVSAVNAALQNKLSVVNSLPLQDKQRLTTYMPDTLDQITILRTMESILTMAGISPTTLEFGAGNDENINTSNSELPEASNQSKTTESETTVAFVADEATMYSFFDLVERSAVPFVVKEAAIAPTEEGLIAVDLLYSVFALAEVSDTTTPETESFEDEMFIDTMTP